MTEVKPDRDGIVRAAGIDPGGIYRWWLTRRWRDSGGAWVHFLMLNPSTADGDTDDPTIRRVIGFGRSWGFVGAVVTNLYAYRATNPELLTAAIRDQGQAYAVGPRGDDYIQRAAAMAAYTVCAWGSQDFAKARARHVLADLRHQGVDLRALRVGRTGTPWHPLYVPAATTANRFDGVIT